ncbi:hypothetical protein H0H93_000476 [Arthromyces matolae]|nr:hypothetical protein H0H93_000476 [Arthromyces matolae]
MGGPSQHVASNSFTRYRPYPTPAQFASSNDLISRTTIFLRRELQVWDHVDIEFLTTFTLSLMKSVDIRSEVAVKLLAEFLDMDVPYEIGGRYVNAEHFAHGKRTTYDVGDEDPQPEPRGRRWARFRSRSRSRSSSRSPSRGTPYRRDRSISYSPSGRYYPSSREAQSTSYGSTSRRSQVPETDQSRSSGSEELLKNTSTPHVDGRYGTSRIEGQSHMGIEGDGQGERFACETPPAAEEAHSEGRSLPAAAPEIEVAQTTTIPAQIPPRPPPTVKPGHRSLAQSVRAHLQRATKDQQPGPSTNHGRSERHRNSAPILRDPTSPSFPPLLHSAFTEACAPSNGATTSATPYALQPPFHVLDSENISSHHEVTSRTKTGQMEISSSLKSQDTSVSQTFLSMSTPTIISDGGDDDENHHHRSSASSSTHPREILLAKLEREKTHAKLEGAVVLRCCAADTSDAKEIITSAAESPRQRIQLPDTTRMQDAIVMDPHAREIKLKKRAQLQARLAAEKRK